MHFASSHGLLVIILVWTQSFKQSQGFQALFSFSQCLQGLSVNSCQKQDMRIPVRDAWTTLQAGRLPLASQIWGARTAFGGNSSVSCSVVMLGVCFMSLTMHLVPPPSLFALWKDVRAAQPRGRVRLRAVSLQEGALEFFSP